jgi:hypothetical protein
MVKKHDSVLVLKRWGEKAPHRLVATVSMGKQHSCFAAPEDFDIVFLKDIHDSFSKRNYGICTFEENVVLLTLIARPR